MTVGKNGATCWMAGAVRIRHFGVMLGQLEILVRRPQSYLAKIQDVLAEKHIKHAARRRLGTGPN